MTKVLPDSRTQMIQWFADRVAGWAADPVSIGLTALQVSDLAAFLAAAQTGSSDATAARIASRDATVVFHEGSDQLRGFGADLIKTIKAFAETTNDANVYAAASVPPPSPPSPTAPPDVPTELTAQINGFGSISIAWKGSRADGTQFVLQRQLTPVDAPPAAWSFAGASTTNDYTDATVPTGFASVSYRVYAQSPAGTSDASTPVVLAFGNSAAGGESLTLAA
jgi:hypothetical protein